eukprot:NP_740970.2 VIG (Drosophila Vasa Intronic Gene) ortholog [Caenorhabditis elegans]
MSTEYGCQVTNKFGLPSDDDDEYDDPRGERVSNENGDRPQGENRRGGPRRGGERGAARPAGRGGRGGFTRENREGEEPTNSPALIQMLCSSLHLVFFKILLFSISLPVPIYPTNCSFPKCLFLIFLFFLVPPFSLLLLSPALSISLLMSCPRFGLLVISRFFFNF